MDPKVEPDDPSRCQGRMKNGNQCNLKAAEGSNYCMYHGGNMAKGAQEKKSMYNFLVGQWRARVSELSTHSDIKTLREEVGVLRLLLENHVNRCSGPADLLMTSHVISDLVTKIERVVLSCNKLEERLGQVLDKQVIINFADQVIAIIGDELDGDDRRLSSISSKILEIFK